MPTFALTPKFLKIPWLKFFENLVAKVFEKKVLKIPWPKWKSFGTHPNHKRRKRRWNSDIPCKLIPTPRQPGTEYKAIQPPSKKRRKGYQGPDINIDVIDDDGAICLSD